MLILGYSLLILAVGSIFKKIAVSCLRNKKNMDSLNKKKILCSLKAKFGSVRALHPKLWKQRASQTARACCSCGAISMRKGLHLQVWSHLDFTIPGCGLLELSVKWAYLWPPKQAFSHKASRPSLFRFICTQWVANKPWLMPFSSLTFPVSQH